MDLGNKIEDSQANGKTIIAQIIEQTIQEVEIDTEELISLILNIITLMTVSACTSSMARPVLCAGNRITRPNTVSKRITIWKT